MMEEIFLWEVGCLTVAYNPEDIGQFPNWGTGAAAYTQPNGFNPIPIGATADTTDPYQIYVNLGEFTPPAVGFPTAIGGSSAFANSINSIGNLVAMWNAPGGLTPDKQLAIQALASLYSGQKSLTSPAGALSFLMNASIMANQNNISVSDQMLRLAGVQSFDQVQSIASTMAALGDGSGPTTITATDYLSEDSANSLVNNALQSYLGRAATDEEKSNFYQALHTAQGNQPSVSTTDQSSRVSTTGLDVNAFAENYAKSQPDYAEYQGATKYLDLFLGALG